MKKILAFLLLSVVLISGCAMKIVDITKEENVGKTFTVSGTVSNSIKIGPISGYTLTDDTGTIGVGTQNLPTEGEKVTVTGILIKDTIFGYYLKPN